MQGFTGEKVVVNVARGFTGEVVESTVGGCVRLRYEHGMIVDSERLSDRAVAIRECAAIVDRRITDLREDRDGPRYSAVLACRELAEDIRRLL